MKLRPRYSLLTLLMLTALVAGGVKLWLGPHHVVEHEDNQGEVLETEHTFTRAWDGSRILQGPYVQRHYSRDGDIYRIKVLYHRQGVRIPLRYTLFVYDVNNTSVPEPLTKDVIQRIPLNREEMLELQQTMLREKQKSPGADSKWFEHLHPIP